MMGDAQSLRSWPARTLAYRLVLWVCFRAPALCCAAGITTDQLLKRGVESYAVSNALELDIGALIQLLGEKNNQRSWKEWRNRIKQRSTAGGGGRGRLTSAGRAVTGSRPPPELGEPSKGCFRQVTADGSLRKSSAQSPGAIFNIQPVECISGITVSIKSEAVDV